MQAAVVHTYQLLFRHYHLVHATLNHVYTHLTQLQMPQPQQLLMRHLLPEERSSISKARLICVCLPLIDRHNLMYKSCKFPAQCFPELTVVYKDITQTCVHEITHARTHTHTHIHLCKGKALSQCGCHFICKCKKRQSCD
jgi:hypothetical protein